ncbi:MAG: peptide ABC transporter permease [Anaerolineales bacterium]|nr:ABC transporter permease [Anaerolineae bacterium]PWB69217.1 MAG: peptide ABC transporter permease [Anaerolineales bacterium]
MPDSTALNTLQDTASVPSTKPLSPMELAVRRFRKHRMAMFGLGLLLLLVLYVSVGGLLSQGYCTPLDQNVRGEDWANCNDTSLKLQPPSGGHIFGTDVIGRDIFARTVYGGQISLLIGVSAAIVEVLLGALIGALAAYYGGWVDSLLMRFTEAMLNIPSLFLLIIGARFFGRGLPSFNFFGRELTGGVVVIIVIIGATSWMYLARIVRANVLSLRERDYVSAARALGASDRRIIFTHLLPNTTAPLIVSATLGVANAILAEAYVSFLGLGVQGATATWGNMLDGAYQYLETAPWLWFFPGTLILLTVLGINFVGDGLRDALDPYSERHV